jgi:hypothetical protein
MDLVAEDKVDCTMVLVEVEDLLVEGVFLGVVG